MLDANGKRWNVARLSLRVAQILLFGVFVQQAYPSVRSVYHLWRTPDLLWYVLTDTGIGALTVLVMFALLRVSKAVVATMASVFAIAGVHDFILYEWRDWMLDDLMWAIPFGLSAICLFISIYFDKRSSPPLPSV
ncbi:hypothetical protein O4H48_11725 [Rhodobacteraceae bacterium G21628-S1]|nr:hypothetical protein [Rhodobacteraceae bacterium G21628-S1]